MFTYSVDFTLDLDAMSIVFGLIDGACGLKPGTSDNHHRPTT